MAGVALNDAVTRLAREVWRLNLTVGFGSRMGWEPGTMGRLAKAAGATEAQVQSWMAGDAEPSTGQALALLDALPLPVTGLAAAAVSGNGSRP